LQPVLGKDTDWGDLVLWMSVNHIAFTATAIRRLADKDKNSISLYRLLEDVRIHVDIVTADNLSKHVKNWQDIGPPGLLSHVAEMAEVDLKLLVSSGDAVRLFVNKMIAHADINAHKITPPTYDEINETFLDFHRIYRKWALALAAVSCQTHDPNPADLVEMDLPDYTAQFTTMWQALST
jgi:AbiU2